MDPLLEISSGYLVAQFGGGLVPGELTINRLASVQRDLVDLAHHQRGRLFRAVVELFGFGEQLEALFRQETEEKLTDAMADVLELCRERWKQLKNTSSTDVVREINSYKENDRKALRHLRSLE